MPLYSEAFEPILEVFSDKGDRFSSPFEGADKAHDPEYEEDDREQPTKDRYPEKRRSYETEEVQAEGLPEVVGGLLVFWVVENESCDPSEEG